MFPLAQKLALARLLVARLHLFRLGGGQIGLGCPQGIALVLIVQPGEDVAGPDTIAHIDLPLDQLAGDAEAQIRFGPRLDRSGDGAGQAEDHGLDGDGPDRPDHRGRVGFVRVLLFAAPERHGAHGHGQKRGRQQPCARLRDLPARHAPLPCLIVTFCPGLSFWLPPITTVSPALSPLDTVTVPVSY